MNRDFSRKDLLVVSGYFPKTSSSYCPFVYDQVCAFVRSGRFNKIIIVNPAQPLDYEFRGLTIIGAGCKSFLCRVPVLGSIIKRRYFMKVLEKHHIDITSLAFAFCHQCEFAVFGLAVREKNPSLRVIVQFHDCDPFRVLACSKRLGFWGVKQMFRFLNSRRVLEVVDACVAVSKNVAKMAMEFPHQQVYLSYEPAVTWARRLRHFRSARIKKIYILHNGVDTKTFNSKGRTVHSDFHIGCFAMCIPLKGYRYLIEAMVKIDNQIREWRMTLIGSGAELELYRELVKEKGLSNRVRFLSGIEHEQMADYFRDLDLFVMPSYFEAFGCVYSEAFACGTPYIACEGQGVDDVIYPEDRHLWLAKPRNSDDLAQKILHYYRFRPTQRTIESVDIDVLVGKFIDEVLRQ